MIKKEKIIEKDENFSYIWRRSRRARYMRLAVYPEGRVVVTTPFYFPEYLMKKGLERKMDWLREKILLLGRLPKKVSLSQGRERYLKHKNQALTLAKNRIEYFNRVYNFSYKKISVRNQKTRWGSCSKAGNLSFNYKIFFLSSDLADYIIVHELCHLKEFNHSKDFWQLVAQIIPDYREKRKKISQISRQWE